MCMFVRNEDGVEVKASDCGKCSCGASSSSHSKTQVDVSVLVDNQGNVVSAIPVYGCGSCGTHMT